jgi:hypothetical protein
MANNRGRGSTVGTSQLTGPVRALGKFFGVKNGRGEEENREDGV